MKCIIIEDELPAQRIIKNYISKFPELELSGSFQSVFDANTFLESNKVDLLFLDINLPEINGLQFIKTISNPPIIIMTTAYHEHAVESFELDTICDYLVKPFSLERFFKAINKAKKQFNPQVSTTDSTVNTNEYIYVNIDKTLHKVKYEEILFVESDKNYVTLHTVTSQLTYIDTLKSWSEKLPDSHFVQVHKSFIVNTHLIDKISGNILIIQGSKIPIGRLYKPKLLERLNLS